MSTMVMDIAWDVAGLSLAQKMVLIALADQANDYGEAYPGLATLQRRCSMSERGVYKCIAELENLELLSRDRLPGDRTLYLLNLARMLQPDLLDPAALKTPTGRARHKRHLHHVQGCTTGRGARRAGVQRVHPAQNDTGRGAPGAVHKATKELTATDIHSAGATDFEGTFEGHENPPPPAAPTVAGEIAVALRRKGYAITSLDPGLLAAVAAGVTLAHVLEFTEIYPPGHPKCAGSGAYVVGAARRQIAQPPDTAPAGGSHVRQPRESEADRIRRIAVEAEERDRAAGADRHADLVDAHG